MQEPKLQENLITLLCHSDEHGRIVSNFVEAALFEGDYRVIAERAIDYWKRHGKAPGAHTPDLVADILEDKNNRRAKTFRSIILDMLRLHADINTDYVINQMKTFTRMQQFKAAVLKSAERLSSQQELAIEEVEEINVEEDIALAEKIEKTEIVARPKFKELSGLEITKENIRKYICPNATTTEIAMFLALCINQNLNPFIKDVYLIKYGTAPAQMIVAKDTFIKRADSLPNYQGFEAGILVKKDNGDIEKREGSFRLSDEILVGGWATVFRKDRKPHYNSVGMIEYNKKKSTWLTMPATMIRKVALVQALREAYPQDFQGMYDQAEMGEIVE